jgi:hypothetical protein
VAHAGNVRESFASRLTLDHGPRDFWDSPKVLWRPVTMLIRICTLLVAAAVASGFLQPDQAQARAGIRYLPIHATATNTSSAFNKYIFSFKLPFPLNFRGLVGDVSTYSVPQTFSEALISVHYSPPTVALRAVRYLLITAT